MSKHILIVDDEQNLAFFVAKTLESNGYKAITAGSVAEAVKAVQSSFPDLMLLDLKLPDGNGLDFFTKMKSEGFDIPTIVITAHGSVQSAIDALKKGVDDFIIKPFDMNEVLLMIGKLLNRFQQRIQLNYYRRKAQEETGTSFFVSDLPRLKELQELALRTRQRRP